MELHTGDRITYSVQRREVQHPRLTLQPDGTLAVVVPGNIPSERLITRHRDWITTQYEDQVRAITDIIREYGDLTQGFTLWGTTYELREINGEYDAQLEQGTLVLSSPSGRPMQPYLRNQVREALRHAIRSLAETYCSMLETDFSTIAIRNQRTKWASCTSGDTLNFNIRCAFLPVNHLKYLVAHEVAHLIYPDHTDAFWQTVESIVQEYGFLRSELQGFWYAVHRNDIWRSILD